MTTTTDTTTAGAQINAAGALLALFTAHRDLPAPRIISERVVTDERDASGTLVLTWGLTLGFHRDAALADFEQWRQALDLDTADVDLSTTGAFAWLSVTTTYVGTPLTLVGYFDLPKSATDAER
ncbi:hypothetical protein GCM10018790_01640 [Kitasatospora xanthocidica]|uniref:hypothetical protein n=1 Tax=Kitasatospora xanthocidica TaxID=83382 RepID=UPI001676CD82|nr:hypothetical protein [Kitasatospora xanthocidica]GHF27922.1 hypothetical protein GCM10018790_01640 [Kitasatospora xanthocidica]